MYLILNFKTYEEATGENALNLARIVSEAKAPANVDIVICPQAADIFRIREQFPDMTIWAQHIDPIDAGKNTGWTSATSVIMAGANGTIINHSEHKLQEPDIIKVLEITNRYQLVSCLAVPDLERAQKLTDTLPDIFAYEPPDLISTGNSLVNVNPAEAEKFVREMKQYETTLILGAGVSTAADVSAAVKIGYDGVLLASAFVKSPHPEQLLAELIAAY